MPGLSAVNEVTCQSRVSNMAGMSVRSTFGFKFPGGSDGKESAYSAGDLGSIPGWGRSPGEGNGNPLQYSCLKNSMGGGAWWAAVHGVAKSRGLQRIGHN